MLPTWEPCKNTMKFGSSTVTFMVPRLPYTKTCSIALIYNSSTIGTDQVVVQWWHWYGSRTLLGSCTPEVARRSAAPSSVRWRSYRMCVRSLVLAGPSTQSFTLTGGSPSFLDTHVHNKAKWYTAYIIWLKLRFKERYLLIFHHCFYERTSNWNHKIFQTFWLLVVLGIVKYSNL